MQAVYYRAADGSEPVDAFLGALRDPARQAALDNQIERLNMRRSNNPPPPFPWSSQLEGELRKLRCHYGSELYRVLYRRSGNLFVLLHMFRKDTGKVPEAELRVARERWGTSRRGWTRSGGGRRERSATTALRGFTRLPILVRCVDH
jgi:phage-related protein